MFDIVPGLALAPSVSVRLTVAAVIAADGGSIRQAPSPSPAAGTSGSSPWLACARNAGAAIDAIAHACAELDRANRRRAPWRAQLLSAQLSFVHVHAIDDADDRRVDRRALRAERLAGRASFEHDQHLLVHAGADAVDRQQRGAARRVVQRSAAAPAAAWRLRTSGASASTTTVPTTGELHQIMQSRFCTSQLRTLTVQ